MPYKDPAQLRARENARRSANREARLAYDAVWRAAHAERLRAYGKARRAARREQEQARLAARRAAHRRELRVYHAAWRTAHPERVRASRARDSASHPDRRVATAARRRAAKQHAPVNDFTVAQWREMLEHYTHRCVYCGRKMQRLTQDHITPLSRGGSHTRANIIPACGVCNSRKGTGNVLVPVQPLLI